MGFLERAGMRGSLRRLWALTSVGFVGLLAAVIVVAVAVSEHQRSAVADTLRDLKEETAATSRLERVVLEATGPMAVVLYRAGDDAKVDAALVEYRAASAAVDEAFDGAQAALHTDDERAFLSAAREEWNRIDPAVMGAESDYTDDELYGMLAQGQDPFVETVWGPLDQVDLHFADLGTETVVDMEQQAGALADVQRGMIPLLLGALAVAIAAAVIGSWQMQRRVLAPLETLVETARTMTRRGVPFRIEVPHAVDEVREVAETLTETAMSLDLTHGLLEEQAVTDSLTSLPNRKAFYARLEAMVENPTMDRVGVLFIDLDDFKDVNDSLGHAAGDQLLHIVGQRLQAATRGCEIVARLGGDEFAVALDLGEDADAAASVAQRIHEVMREPVRLEGAATRIGCSIGVAVADASGDVSGVLANADFAMYMAKSRGKACSELHSPSLHFEMLTRMELRRDLADALDRDQFEVHYQPVIDLDTEELLGFEALVRWNHPTLGLLAPAEFITIAEETGAIVDLGAWVLDTACRQLAELHRDDPSLIMSVNVAPQQLTDPDLVRTVINATLGHGFPPDRLVLEITESTAIANTAEGVAVLEELRSHGVHIALDDFGTGFSSLRYLSDLPVDVIKIDRSFVAGRGDSETSMLESIISLAQRLGLHIVAEGIEVSDDLDRLRGFQRIAGQGYLFARPMRGSDIHRFRDALEMSNADGRPLRSV